MNYPQPTEHFQAFSSVWHDLKWTFDSNEFPEAAINSDTGEIFITRNISIWPSWPTQDYNQVVRVSNSESCYSSTCSFKIRIHFTNWPIEIRSLPLTVYLHEDYDLEMKIHSLVTFDYNYHLEDNVTCQIVDWFPKEDNMFELRHDGNHEYDSYSLYKLRCQDPDCGYKYQQPRAYYCDTDIGCLTHNRTQEYTVTIQCWDAYNSTDVENLTFRVVKNALPAYINLPTKVELHRQNVSYLDTIFEIMYSDAEKENLIYEYSYQDVDTNVDPGYFLGTSWGNYYNQLGNITMTTYLWDKEVNKTYKIHVCGHERRNEICEDLIVDVKDFKIPPEITNLPDSKTFPEDTPVGATLFTAAISNPDVGESITVTVSVDPDSEQSVFNLDTLNGILTLGKILDYERVNSYMLTFSVRDDYLDGQAEKTLKISVTNVNEGNSISATTTTISFTEDTTAGTELSDPELSCTDIDGDTTQYAIQSGLYNDYFSIDSKNGRIALVKVWDLEDSSTTLPSSTSLIISCTDLGGLSSTTAITVNVQDVNDHAPVLLIDANYSQPIAINASTNLNTNLMTFSASDLDFSDDNNFGFEIMSEGVGAEYFQIVKSGPATAILRLKKNADFTNDQVFPITINVSDGETMPLFDGETISVIFTAGDPDADKSKPKDCFTCTTTGITLLIVLVGVSVGLSILPIIFICCKLKSDSAVHTLPNMENQSMQQISEQPITVSELSGEHEGSAIEISQMGRTCIDNGRSEESNIHSIIM
ncbi:cadherin-12-like [Ruditapes philippinarum]|uniref:cadherin-12-like n=1 Tax=Ruditapes philippinarum TaxID=129788 RepID=UPI00295B42A4|nr:cadherin-12-like [Ruditapes philippinarum]